MKTGSPPEIRAAILLRDGELCAMQGTPGCHGHRADEANHRLNRGTGGSTDPIINTPSNGCALEHGCNWRLEQVAEFAEEGRRRGVKLTHGDDPTRVPMWSPFFRQWVVLALDGLHLTGVTDPNLDARRADEWLGVLR